MEDWSESSEIHHLLRDVIPSYCKKRAAEAERKRAKKPLAVRIMSPEDEHPRILEYFHRNVGEPDLMIPMKILVCVEVFGDTAGGCLLRLNNVEWRLGEKLTMLMIPARMSLDSIVPYVSVDFKLNSKKEWHPSPSLFHCPRGIRHFVIRIVLPAKALVLVPLVHLFECFHRFVFVCR